MDSKMRKIDIFVKISKRKNFILSKIKEDKFIIFQLKLIKFLINLILY